MTREEQLKSCTICTHHCMDMHKGLLCGLTNEFADFEGVCLNFEQDEKEVQKQEYKQHGYKRKKERNLAFTDYDEEAIRAAREYAEGLFTPAEVKDPEYQGSIDAYAMDFEAGADWYKLNRKASYEEVEEAANQYGREYCRNMVVDVDENSEDGLDIIDNAVMGFIEGAEWCEQYIEAKHADIRRCLWWALLALFGVFFISLIIFSPK